MKQISEKTRLRQVLLALRVDEAEVKQLRTVCLFVRLISHQPAVLFSQNKPATSQQYFSLTTNQHQPSAKRTGRLLAKVKNKSA
jgi:hypothetical protein